MKMAVSKMDFEMCESTSSLAEGKAKFVMYTKFRCTTRMLPRFFRPSASLDFFSLCLRSFFIRSSLIVN
jgi:hypothetical protein